MSSFFIAFYNLILAMKLLNHVALFMLSEVYTCSRDFPIKAAALTCVPIPKLLG